MLRVMPAFAKPSARHLAVAFAPRKRRRVACRVEAPHSDQCPPSPASAGYGAAVSARCRGSGDWCPGWESNPQDLAIGRF
jgi:hypothetical protein